MPTPEELYNWKLNALILVQEIEMRDQDFRNNNPNHRCDSWYENEKGRWFCKHVELARKQNKTLQKLELLQTMSSPVLRGTELGEMAERLYRESFRV